MDHLARWLLSALILLSFLCWIRWREDLGEIGRMLPETVRELPPSEKMRAALEFMKLRVAYGSIDDYFLLPIFSFLQPTALQVIHRGGDCADRARAYIVLLRVLGVKASKLALHHGLNVPVHSVARVETERGTYLVDVLYDFIHEDAEGDPIPLEALAPPAPTLEGSVLEESVARAVRSGNTRAAEYPFWKYKFDNVRTINWEKNGFLRSVYGLLVLSIGEEQARELPRPYLAEEPALMVIVGCLPLAAACAVALGSARLARRRQHAPSRPSVAPNPSGQ